MNQDYKVAVIGATGKSGKFVLAQLLELGIACKVLLRKPEHLSVKSNTVEVLQGDARNYQSILELIRGCQAVVSTLGQPAGEPSIFSQATDNVIEAMNTCGLKRYILTTGLNVDCLLDNKSDSVRMATEWMRTNYPETTRDKQLEYELLVRSNLDWTLIRLPLIELSQSRSEIICSEVDCPGTKISAASLAFFIAGQLTDIQYIRRSPFIANQ